MTTKTISFFGLCRLQPNTASRYLRSYVDILYPLCSLGKSLLVTLTRSASVCHFFTPLCFFVFLTILQFAFWSGLVHSMISLLILLSRLWRHLIIA